MSASTFRSLETVRLVLRRFEPADVPLFLAYRNDPEVARYQSWYSISETEAQEFVRRLQSVEPGVPGEWFQFAIERKSTGHIVGDCGLKVHAEDPRQAEFGITLSRPVQRQGLATEAVTCLLEYAFGTLRLHRVIAIADCRNAPSTKLMERVGMRREGHFIENIRFKGEWGDEYLYALLEREWRR